MEKVKIAIFASGRGSNAKKIIEQASDHNYEVELLISNKKDAPVLTIAEQHGIAVLVITKEMLYQTNEVIEIVHTRNITMLVLAGFLWLIPSNLVAAFPNKVLNIHPSLLPKYGGKGMYGMHVHQAVYDNGEAETGITVHIVDEVYDRGEIIFQKKVSIEASDTPEKIAEKVLFLEHHYYPIALAQFISSQQP